MWQRVEIGESIPNKRVWEKKLESNERKPKEKKKEKGKEKEEKEVEKERERKEKGTAKQNLRHSLYCDGMTLVGLVGVGVY